MLLETELIRVDFVMSRTGFLQVLINLLKFYSENILNSYESTASTDESKKEHAVLTSLKRVFCLIGRLLLKLNENQDIDLFGYYANALINLCFNSNSNHEFQNLNLNIKEIFLKITNSIIGDLNFIYTNTTETSISNTTMSSAAYKSTALLKKIITPLMSSTSSASTPTTATPSSNRNPLTALDVNEPSLLASGLFDSDMIFQKFITFIVDFIHIVFDKISDTQLDDTKYDVNDELSISSFTVLAECLAISLENNQRAKFTNLFRNNLNLIRFQVRKKNYFA